MPWDLPDVRRDEDLSTEGYDPSWRFDTLSGEWVSRSKSSAPAQVPEVKDSQGRLYTSWTPCGAVLALNPRLQTKEVCCGSTPTILCPGCGKHLCVSHNTDAWHWH